MRGHVNMWPVPALGGGVIALFPFDLQGKCMCTPKPDPGLLDNNIITTTTAMAYPRDLGVDVADVCIVRLLISQYLPCDVNSDLVVNQTDLDIVYSSPFFAIDPQAPSRCPLVRGRHVCGVVDVNRDGKVNQLDSTSITQSLYMGSNATCGGVYALAFSCGSSRRAPLTPALDISLDNIVFFSDDGLLGNVTAFTNYPAKRSMSSRSVRSEDSLLTTVMDQIEKIENENHELRQRLETETARLNAETAQLNTRLNAETAQLREKDKQLESKDKQLESKFESKTVQLESKDKQFESKTVQLESKVKEHDSKLERFGFKSPDLVGEVLASVAVVLVAAILAIAWRRFRKD